MANVFGVPDAESGKPSASVSGVSGDVLDVDRLRERRLLRQAASRSTGRRSCCDRRRNPRESPATSPAPAARPGRDAVEGRADRRARATSGYALPVSVPTGSLARTGAAAAKPGATSRLTRRPNCSVSGDSYSHRTPRLSGQGRRDAPVVVDVRLDDRSAQELVGVAERDRAAVRDAEQEVGEVRSGGRAGEREHAARVLLAERVVAALLRTPPPNVTL